jgi:hypothetical protein
VDPRDALHKLIDALDKAEQADLHAAADRLDDAAVGDTLEGLPAAIQRMYADEMSGSVQRHDPHAQDVEPTSSGIVDDPYGRLAERVDTRLQAQSNEDSGRAEQ